MPVAKITAVVFALLFGLGVPQALADDAPGDTASGTAGDFRTSPIAAIDARSEVIAENLAEYESQVKNYTLPGGDGTILIYREGGELRKMTVLTDGDGASSSDEFYFWDQDLILIVSVWESFPLWPEQLTSDLEFAEERHYFQDGALIGWYITTSREIDPRDELFRSRQFSLFRDAQDYLQFSQTDFEDLYDYLESSPTHEDWRVLDAEGAIEDLPEDVLIFLTVLETAVEQHAWEEVLAMAEPDHYFTQVLDLGMSHDQYIKELLGLGFVDNDIDPPPDSASEYPAGDRIRDISYGSWKLDRDWLKILGTIQDDRGSSLRLTLLLKRTSRGIVLSGAVG